jgi:hypothetical protein
MAASIRLLGLLLAAGVLLAQGAAAQSVADTATRWGLIGTWSVDCSKPASGSNGHLIYLVRAGKVVHERDFGDRRDTNDVQQARTGIGGALDLVVHFPALNQTRKFTMMMGPDRRIRAVANSRIDGTDQTIKDGKFTANGATTPWQSRCR